jgi:hypothetical protein
MDNINNQTPLSTSSYLPTDNDTIHFNYKIESIDDIQNYLDTPLTITELFPEIATNNIKNDVFFGVATNVQPETTGNKMANIIDTINCTIEEESLLPSEFLKRNQSFREEDLYINTLNTELFSELT